MHELILDLPGELFAAVLIGAITLIYHFIRNYKMNQLSREIDKSLSFTMEKTLINIQNFSKALRKQKEILDEYIQSGNITVDYGNLMLRKLELYGHEFRSKMLAQLFDKSSPFFSTVNWIIRDQRVEKKELKELFNEIKESDGVLKEEKEELTNIILQLLDNIPVHYHPYTSKGVNPYLILKKNIHWVAGAVLLVAVFYVIFIKPGGDGSDREEAYSKYVMIREMEGTAEERTKMNMSELLYYYLNQFDGLYIIQEKRINKSVLKDKRKWYLTGELNDVNSQLNEEKEIIIRMFSDDSSKIHEIYKDTITNKNVFISEDINRIGNEFYKIAYHLDPDTLSVRKSTEFLTEYWEAFSCYINAKESWSNEYLRDAKKSLKTALELDRDFTQAALLLAEINIFDGNYGQAEKSLTELLQRKKKFIERNRVYLQALRCYVSNKENLISNLKALKESSLYNADIWYKIGETYFRNMNFKEASTNLRAVIKIDSNFVKAYNYLGYSELYRGNYDEALSYLDQFRKVKQTPNSYDSYGDGFYYRGDYDQAVCYKLEAIKKDMDLMQNLWIDNSLSLIYSVMGLYGQAYNRNEFYLVKIGDQPERIWRYYFTKAWIHYCEENYEKAYMEIETSIEHFEKNGLNYRDNPELKWLRAIITKKSQDMKIQSRFHRTISELGEEVKEVMEIKREKKIIDHCYQSNIKFFLDLRLILCKDQENRELALEIADYMIRYQEEMNYHATIFNARFFLKRCAEILNRMECKEKSEEILSIITPKKEEEEEKTGEKNKSVCVNS